VQAEWARSTAPVIASLKDSRLVVDPINGTAWINVAPDGSPILTRDAGYQELYALNIKWP